MFTSRTDFQKMAQAKFEDAAFLLEHSRQSNAYYLAGYAVELGLKAAICRQIIAECLPDRRLVEDVYRYGHDLRRLVNLAGLSEALSKAAADAKFKVNWSIAAQWSEAARYEMIDAFRAVELVSAIGDKDTGVLQWVKLHW